MAKIKVEKVKKVEDPGLKADPLTGSVLSDNPDQVPDEIPEVEEILERETKEAEQEVAAIDEDLAAELLNLPFEVADMFWSTGALSDQELKRLAGPFSRVLVKYGLEKLSRDEVVFGFWLSVSVLSRVKIYQRKKGSDSEVKNKADGRQAGPGENNSNQKPIGSF